MERRTLRLGELERGGTGRRSALALGPQIGGAYAPLRRSGRSVRAGVAAPRQAEPRCGTGPGYCWRLPGFRCSRRLGDPRALLRGRPRSLAEDGHHPRLALARPVPDQLRLTLSDGSRPASRRRDGCVARSFIMSKEDTIKVEFTEKELTLIQTLISDRIGGIPTEYSRETCVGSKLLGALAQLHAGKMTRFFFPFFGGPK